ncbi:MAG: hypothetical protein R3A10_22350 [Caldilineaceae bacterium]
MHIGEQEQARELARVNLAAMPTDADAIITNAAGCGSGMREYPLPAGEPEETQAQAFAAVRDISVFLAELGIETSLQRPSPSPTTMRVIWPMRST